jgi:hypothetical protein
MLDSIWRFSKASMWSHKPPNSRPEAVAQEFGQDFRALASSGEPRPRR